jgi:hypothetical protein
MAEQDIAFDPNDPEAMRRLQSFINPQQVDQQIRQAIQFCWMMLPAEKKTVDEVEKEIRRIVDRALRDLREDSSAFRWGHE